MGVTIEVQKIGSFETLRQLDKVSISVEEKSITILICPNASGKTTLINLTGDQYKLDSDKMFYLGKEITKVLPHKIYRLGLARFFEAPTQFSNLTVLENVLVTKEENPSEGLAKSLLKGTWIEVGSEATGQAFTMLKFVGLSQIWDKPATSLSGGEMNRLEIARALMSNSRTLILNESVSGANPTLENDIFSRLIILRENYGITFLNIDRRLDIAFKYTQEVIAKVFGKLVTAGKPEAVMYDQRVIEAYLGG